MHSSSSLRDPETRITSLFNLQNPETSAHPHGALSVAGPAGWLPGPDSYPCCFEHGFLVRGHRAHMFISLRPLAKRESGPSSTDSR